MFDLLDVNVTPKTYIVSQTFRPLQSLV